MNKLRARTKAALMISASCFGLGLVSAASAQEGGAPQVEEIVVTAQRRSESLQRVPGAVTAVTGEQMAARRISTPDGIVRVTPNLQVTSTVGEGTPIFALRGVSMSDYSLNQSPPVATYFDDVYRGNFALLGVSLYDVARVEVLRGPQGTLYGKNTTGGAVNIISREPDPSNEAELTLGVGSYNRREASGYVQHAVSDNIAVRAAFTAEKADGWLKNRLPGQRDLNAIDQYGGRLSVAYEPNDQLKFLLRVSASSQTPTNYGVIALAGPDGVGAGLYSTFNSLYPASNPRPDYFRTGLDENEIESNLAQERRAKTRAAALTTTWSGDVWRITSITSFDAGKLLVPEDTDGSPLRAVEIIYYGRAEQIAQDLRANAKLFGKLDLLVGAFAARERVFNATDLFLFADLDVDGDGATTFQDCVAMAPYACRTRNQFHQEKTTLAVYSDAGLALTEGLTLRAGIRYTHDDAELTRFKSQLFGMDDLLLANLIPGDPANLDATTGRAFKANRLSGQLGLDYRTGDNLFYGKVSWGYRAGAFNAQAYYDPSELNIVKPETLTAYELGWKAQFFDRRLQVNSAVFHYAYENQQFIDVDSVSLAQNLVNLPRAYIRGAEIEATARPISSLTITASVGLLDSRIEEGALKGQSLVGKRLANAPEATARLGVDWDVYDGPQGRLTLSVDDSFSSKQHFEVFNRDSYAQEDHHVLNGQLRFRSTDDSWSAAVWAKNLGEARYYTSRIDVSGSGFQYNQVGTPRTYGVSVTHRLY